MSYLQQAIKFKYGMHFYEYMGRSVGVLNLRRNFREVPGLAKRAGKIGGRTTHHRHETEETPQTPPAHR